jgi:hypothetical protein
MNWCIRFLTISWTSPRRTFWAQFPSKQISLVIIPETYSLFSRSLGKPPHHHDPIGSPVHLPATNLTWYNVKCLWGLGCGSVIQHMLSMHESVSLITRPKRERENVCWANEWVHKLLKTPTEFQISKKVARTSLHSINIQGIVKGTNSMALKLDRSKESARFKVKNSSSEASGLRYHERCTETHWHPQPMLLICQTV